MKRFLSILIIVAILSALLPVLVIGVSAQDTASEEGVTKTSSDGTYSITLEKTEFKKNEPIYVTATGNHVTDWIGIAKAGSTAYLDYYYLGQSGFGTAFDMLKVLTLEAGEYELFLVPNNGSNYSNATVTGVTFTVTEEEYTGDSVISLTDIGDTSRLTTKDGQKEFKKGEPIYIAATGEDKDWIGIYDDVYDESYSKYYYVDGMGGSGNYYNINADGSLSTGTHFIRLIYASASNTPYSVWTIAGIYITVTDEEYTEPDVDENPDQGGDTDTDQGGDTASTVTVTNGAHSLGVNKTKYEVGEAIWVTAVGVDSKDWIGIAERGYTEGTIRWYYITEPGSNVAYNIKNAPNISGGLSSLADIPEGLYTIYLVEKDAYLKNGFALSINISVGDVEDSENGKTSGGTEESDELLPPLSATYELANDTDGYAKGTVSVTMPSDSLDNRSIVMYWADASGKLSGYTAHARFKVTGETTTFTFSDSVLIPEGATCLHIHSQSTNLGTISEEYVTVDLPEGASMESETPLTTFFIISDIHIGKDGSAENFKKMLNEAIALNPNGTAIFIVGDMADNGTEEQFAEMVSLHSEVMTANSKNAEDYPLFLTLGNHDYPAMSDVFLNYAKLPDGTNPTDTSYDFWLNGYHYIFLGSDTSAGLYANLTEETLSWLDEKLAECRDESRPTFVFLHQPMSGTVSGSLEGEGWDGVMNEEALRAVLKKYPEVMMFNGHTHWTMDSVGNIYEGTEELPIHIFNCASVSYLWSGYNVVTGESLSGSQGYYIEMYDGKVIVRGRDFINGEWISAAQYCVEMAESDGKDGHTCVESVVYENGYMNNGILTSKCSVCNSEQITEVKPLFTFNGYSMSIFNPSSICAGYVINRDILEKYVASSGAEIMVGFVAAPYDYLVEGSKGKPINSDGTVAQVTGGRVINYEIAEDYKYVNLILRSSDWNVYQDYKAILCAYIIENGRVGYICDTEQITDTADYITYSEIKKSLIG